MGAAMQGMEGMRAPEQALHSGPEAEGKNRMSLLARILLLLAAVMNRTINSHNPTWSLVFV
jgi:hypothetical protein